MTCNVTAYPDQRVKIGDVVVSVRRQAGGAKFVLSIDKPCDTPIHVQRGEEFFPLSQKFTGNMELPVDTAFVGT